VHPVDKQVFFGKAMETKACAASPSTATKYSFEVNQVQLISLG